MENNAVYALFVTISFSCTLIVMIAACLCCRKKVPKNEFLGLAGMVKIKNPEETSIISFVHESNGVLKKQNESSPSSNGTDRDNIATTESKRASNAPHRSLPDIPITEPLNDNGSELYATVADKVQQKPQGHSPIPSLKKQTSVSQHSSISQADDISSPYARVRTPPHAYDKVRATEHPYAQLNNNAGPSTAQVAVPSIESSAISSVITSRRGSNQSLLEIQEIQQEIPAASAIAGMVSASQELPYMTPPIQSHFSGDSQDSSKGYTSISVREPLANILAQTAHPMVRLTQKDVSDSHYATVSDDSDEMYAAIEDPISHGDIYTSGSETYAQIQPTNAITVSVEINATAGRLSQAYSEPQRMVNFIPLTAPLVSTTSSIAPTSNKPLTKMLVTEIPPPNVDSLKSQMHSRQASCSSNTGSIANIGSPKPEKRQANSPLPPTPKNLQYLSNSNLTSSSSIPSGRNSVASVIECVLPPPGSVMSSSQRIISKENISSAADSHDVTDSDCRKKNLSPSKDIEGMYAKVMKKNKFSSVPSQNSSPILSRKLLCSSSNNASQSSDLSVPEVSIKDITLNPMTQSSPDRRRPRSNSYDIKDHGYETIPADKVRENNNSLIAHNRRSDGYAQIIQKEFQYRRTASAAVSLDTPQITERFLGMEKFKISATEPPGYESLPDQSLQNANDPGYEQLLKPTPGGGVIVEQKPNSDYDPNYEVLRPIQSGGSDDGYAKVVEKSSNTTDDDTLDGGYSRVKEKTIELSTTGGGYSSIKENKSEHDYASINEANKQRKISNESRDTIPNCSSGDNNNKNLNNNEDRELYASIPNQPPQNLPFLDLKQKLLEQHNYQTISETHEELRPTTTRTPSPERLIITPGSSVSDPGMKCSSTSNTLSSGGGGVGGHGASSSNYESLTGSESDPNYESVKYLQSENPYERLHNDASSVSPDTPNTCILAAVSPNAQNGCKTNGTNQVATAASTNTSTNSPSLPSIEVDDYFQV